MNDLIIDNFAGGGGASTGMEAALGRPIDIAINHDPKAIAMHKVNHPETLHLNENVWDIDPVEVCKGRTVGLAWFSPDCTHFSRAKGAKPVKKKIRGLAWVVLKWAKAVKPKVIMLENVEEFTTWGPLVTKDCGNQFPCPDRKGQTFDAFVNALKKQGYRVEYRSLKASDYGAPTIRKRLFMIARCDGNPIVWPAPTHGEGPGLKPVRAAAECIDFSLPCPSIFERKKPLAESTCRRIAKGIMKFVINNPDPFIVQTGYGEREGQSPRVPDINKPLGTIVAGGIKHALVTPYIVGAGGPTFGGEPRKVDKPINTILAENRKALVLPYIQGIAQKGSNGFQGNDIKDPMRTLQAKADKTLICAHFIAKHYTGVVGSGMEKPLGTVTAKDHNSLITSHIIKHKGTNLGHDMRAPLQTICSSTNHFGEVRAFLIKYYGTNIGSDLKGPMHTVTSKERFGLVTIKGIDYAIVDIGLRMLQPSELKRAQGFNESYIIDHDETGKTFYKKDQVRMLGNSVCPPMAEALVRANIKEVAETQERAVI